MLRITIELVPNGDIAKKRTLEIMDISTFSDPSTLISDYVVEAMSANGSHKKRGAIRGHDPGKIKPGSWALVARAIRALNLDLGG